MKLDQAKVVADSAAVTITIGAVVDWLPEIAALVSIIWTGIRIFETDTVRRWMGKEPL